MEELKKEEILAALAKMWNQYCGERGHLFMSAGEHASEVLMKAGLLGDEYSDVDWKKIDELNAATPPEN